LYVNCYTYATVYSFHRDDNDLVESGGHSILNMSESILTGTTVWLNNDLNCVGNEVCITSCLSSIPTSSLNECSSEVGVRCSKYC